MISRRHDRVVVVTHLTRQTFRDERMGQPAPLIGSWEEEFLLKDYTTPWAFLNAIAQAFIRDRMKINGPLYAVQVDRNSETQLIHTKVMGFVDTDPQIAHIVCAIVNTELFYLK